MNNSVNEQTPSCHRCDVEHKRGSAACPAARIGQTIAGRYVLEQLIGVGGMGAVYRARHIELELPVAVKMLLSSLASTTEFVERFRREAKAVASLQHPGITRVMDYGRTDDGCPYMVMELLVGRPLTALLAMAPLPVEQSLEIILPVLKCLASAHAAGIIHRDIKPDNIFLINRGGVPEVKLLDFGIARVIHDGGGRTLTNAGAVLGSPVYMSREQLEDFKSADHRADLYSAGAVLFQLLTGQTPVQRGSLLEVVSRIARGHVCRHPGSLRPDLPPWLDAVVARSLAEAPVDRFQSAQQMVAAIEQGLGHSAGASPREGAALEFDPFLEPATINVSLTAVDHHFYSSAESAEVTLPSLMESTEEAGRGNVEAAGHYPEAAGSYQEAAGHYPEAAGHYQEAAGNHPEAAGTYQEAGGDYEKPVWIDDLSEGPDAALEGEKAAEYTPRAGAGRRRALQWIAACAVACVALAAGYWLAGRFLDGSPAQTADRGTDGVETAAPPPSVASSEQDSGTTSRELVISTRPDGAEVWLNGVSLGARTPTTIRLPPGPPPITIEIRREGYEPLVEEFYDSLVSRQYLTRALTPLKGATLSVDSRPQGASVTLDGVATGAVTPYSSPALDTSTPHRVTLTLAGYQTWSDTVRLETDTQHELFAELRRPTRGTAPTNGGGSGDPGGSASTASAAAFLKLNAIPWTGVSVWVDGAEAGPVPVKWPVKAGTHDVVFVLAAEGARKQIQVEVRAGEEHKVVWDFSRQQWLAR